MQKYVNKKSGRVENGKQLKDGRHKISNKILSQEDVKKSWTLQVTDSDDEPALSRRERAGKVNPIHLQEIRKLPCAACGAKPPSQAAHSNQALHGKGKSTKADDLATFPLCATCHKRHDEHRGDGWREQENQMIAASMIAIYGDLNK